MPGSPPPIPPGEQHSTGASTGSTRPVAASGPRTPAVSSPPIQVRRKIGHFAASLCPPPWQTTPPRDAARPTASSLRRRAKRRSRNVMLGAWSAALELCTRLTARSGTVGDTPAVGWASRINRCGQTKRVCGLYLFTLSSKVNIFNFL